MSAANTSGGADDRPAVPSLHRASPIQALGQRLIQAQRQLRILEAIHWDQAVGRDFFAAGATRQPAVHRAYYRRRPLPFDPNERRRELDALERDLVALSDDPAGALLQDRCRQTRLVVDLLQARGTPAFSSIADRLYDRSSPGDPDDSSLVARLERTAAMLDPDREGPLVGAAEAAVVLTRQLAAYFGDPAAPRVRLCAELSSDASASNGCIKLQEKARFTRQQVRLLEVHEGWVHLGTTLNGQGQDVCGFLARPCPGTTATQEGLAVLLELWMGVSSRQRLLELARRVEAVSLARAGATFLDVYRHLLRRDLPPQQAYKLAARVFRGGLPEEGGAFPKDVCYARGLWRVARFIEARPEQGTLALLFCGKTSLEEMPYLEELSAAGLVSRPRHVPPILAQTPALTSLGWCRSLLGAVN